jgi:hypothetical protein
VVSKWILLVASLVTIRYDDDWLVKKTICVVSCRKAANKKTIKKDVGRKEGSSSSIIFIFI